MEAAIEILDAAPPRDAFKITALYLPKWGYPKALSRQRSKTSTISLGIAIAAPLRP